MNTKVQCWAVIACGFFWGAHSNGAVATLTGPLTFKGHDYFLLDGSNWLDAEAQAQSMGGHLVTINNQSEQDWLFSTFGSWLGAPRALWTGFNDRPVEGRFEWISGDPVTFTNWAPGEPNNNATGEGEDCVALWPPGYGNAGQWNDLAWWTTPFERDGRTVNLYGVVEVPESSSVPLLTIGLAALAALRCRLEV